MAIIDLFSKRQKALRGDVPDVYAYNDLPHALRAQIVHIWNDSLGSRPNYYANSQVREAYELIVGIL